MIGQNIGDFRIVRLLGQGAKAKVYEAVHDQIELRVAIKIVPSQPCPQIAQRFRNEARALNIVQHPGLVGILECGQSGDGLAYLIMEYLRGETLSARFKRRGRRLGPEILRLGRQIARTMAAVHRQGIVHRDLKPDNVMIIEDPEAPGGERIKIVDFGIAKLAWMGADDHWQLGAGAILGTPVFMAPEQWSDPSAVDGKADVYSLGVMLYEMLAGRAPFADTNIYVLITMHASAAPRPIKALNPSVPEELAALIHRMLAKDPAARPTMDQIAAILASLETAFVTKGLEDTLQSWPLPGKEGAGQRFQPGQDRQLPAPGSGAIVSWHPISQSPTPNSVVPGELVPRLRQQRVVSLYRGLPLSALALAVLLFVAGDAARILLRGADAPAAPVMGPALPLVDPPPPDACRCPQSGNAVEGPVFPPLRTDAVQPAPDQSHWQRGRRR